MPTLIMPNLGIQYHHEFLPNPRLASLEVDLAFLIVSLASLEVDLAFLIVSLVSFDGSP